VDLVGLSVLCPAVSQSNGMTTSTAPRAVRSDGRNTEPELRCSALGGAYAPRKCAVEPWRSGATTGSVVSRRELQQALHLQMCEGSRFIGEGEMMAYWFLRNAVVVVFAIMIAGALITWK
jgi:hypothetical protein